MKIKIGQNKLTYNISNNKSFFENPAYTHFLVYFAQTIRSDELLATRKLLERNSITLMKYNKKGPNLNILNTLPSDSAGLLAYIKPTTAIYIGGLKVTTKNTLLNVRSLQTGPLTLVYSVSSGQILLNDRYDIHPILPIPTDILSVWPINYTYMNLGKLPYLWMNPKDWKI